MDFFVLASLAAVVLYVLKTRDERERIRLLGSHLGHFQIEKLMETLNQGYMRALAEGDGERREQIWRQMQGAAERLSDQFGKFASAFSKVGEADAQVSTLAFSFPYARRLFPGKTFDMRKLLAVHAEGLAQTSRNAAQLAPKQQAFTMSAEMLLMQHSCHWFCKSRAIASARMVMRHQTVVEQLVASVAPGTRAAYLTLTQG